jgi:exonuclease III
MGRSQRTSAGTAILVDMATAPLVKAHGILMEGRAQFVALQSPNSKTLTIVNVYAPCSSSDRAPLCLKINNVEFTADHIIVGGDFNHLEEVDRIGTTGERQMHRRETTSWHHMTLHYGLADAWRLDNFRKMSQKEFTYDNGRSGTRSTVSRIDKFLVSQEIEERGGRIEVAASVRKFIDHLPWSSQCGGTTPPPKQPLAILRRLLVE